MRASFSKKERMKKMINISKAGKAKGCFSFKALAIVLKTMMIRIMEITRSTKPPLAQEATQVESMGGTSVTLPFITNPKTFCQVAKPKPIIKVKGELFTASNAPPQRLNRTSKAPPGLFPISWNARLIKA